MTHASLFSGIGGFDLAAEWMGWDNIFHCEWNPFGQRVLAHHFPNSKSYNDITKTDFTIHRGQIDVLTGGFPCQPYSQAGKRLGKEDERHLWPEMLRTIQEVQPRWVVGENVLGLVNWNGGLVFEEVQTDLEAKGYEVQAYVLPACAKNAPHRRDRVWFVAYSNLYRQQQKWGYDRSSKNVDGSNNEKFRTTNTENFNRCDTYEYTKREYGTNGGISISAINEKNKIANTNGFCKMDKNNSESERISGENKSETDKNRTLVQNGQSRIQLPNNTGLDCFQETLSSSKLVRSENDLSRINRMDWNATNPNSNGLHECNSKNEINASKRRINAFSNIDESIINGYASDTSCIGGRENEWFRNRKSDVNYKISKEGLWEKFPTVSPICNGDDGIPKQLDGITFSKWRKESIKAGGNAIVPQVALEIFKAIQSFDDLVNV